MLNPRNLTGGAVATLDDEIRTYMVSNQDALRSAPGIIGTIVDLMLKNPTISALGINTVTEGVGRYARRRFGQELGDIIESSGHGVASGFHQIGNQRSPEAIQAAMATAEEAVARKLAAVEHVKKTTFFSLCNTPERRWILRAYDAVMFAAEEECQSDNTRARMHAEDGEAPFRTFEGKAFRTRKGMPHLAEKRPEELAAAFERDVVGRTLSDSYDIVFEEVWNHPMTNCPGVINMAINAKSMPVATYLDKLDAAVDRGAASEFMFKWGRKLAMAGGVAAGLATIAGILAFIAVNVLWISAVVMSYLFWGATLAVTVLLAMKGDWDYINEFLVVFILFACSLVPTAITRFCAGIPAAMLSIVLNGLRRLNPVRTTGSILERLAQMVRNNQEEAEDDRIKITWYRNLGLQTIMIITGVASVVFLWFPWANLSWMPGLVKVASVMGLISSLLIIWFALELATRNKEGIEAVEPNWFARKTISGVRILVWVVFILIPLNFLLLIFVGGAVAGIGWTIDTTKEGVQWTQEKYEEYSDESSSSDSKSSESSDPDRSDSSQDAETMRELREKHGK